MRRGRCSRRFAGRHTGADSLGASGVDQARAERIREVVRIVQESGVGEITIDEGGMRVSVRRTPDPIEPVLASAAGEGGMAEAEEAFSPPEAPRRRHRPRRGADGRHLLPGHRNQARRRSSRRGTRVGPARTLCILEAMKLMNEVKADVEAVVRAIHVGNAEAWSSASCSLN
jgi:oxaloacetate decarboxylase alpha subunit